MKGTKTHCKLGHVKTQYANSSTCQTCNAINAKLRYYRKEHGIKKPARTHCTLGHELTKSGNAMCCLTCRRAAHARRKAAKPKIEKVKVVAVLPCEPIPDVVVKLIHRGWSNVA